MREGMKRGIVDLRTAARKNSIYAFAAIKKNNKSLHTAVSRQYLTPTHTPAAAARGGGGSAESMVGKCLHVLSRFATGAARVYGERNSVLLLKLPPRPRIHYDLAHFFFFPPMSYRRCFVSAEILTVV